MTLSDWKKEHFDCMYSHKNLDECCKDFATKFPKIKLSSIFGHWNHKNQYRKQYENLSSASGKQKQVLVQTVSSDLPQEEKVKIIREAILALNLKNGEKIPWEKLYKKVPTLYKLKSLVSFVTCVGGYAYLKKNNTFSDIIEKDGWEYVFKSPKQSQKPVNTMICPSCKNLLVPFNGQLKCDKCGYIRIDERTFDTGLHTIILKTKAITEPIKNERVITNVVDDDEIKLWKYRDQRSQQVQLMKEMVSAIQKSNLTNKDILDALNKNTDAVIKMVQGIEEARAATKKKTELSVVTA